MTEFGGYLPLELARKEEYFKRFDIDLLRLNCGRSAIYAALEHSKPSKVYIPYYNCDTVKEPFERLSVPYEYYKINEDLLPINVTLHESEYLLYTNYFGIAGKSKLDYILNNYRNVYFDNTQAFFSQPYAEAYNIYSCRKFFGVSDGAYLVKNGITQVDYPTDISYDRMQFTMRCIDETTNDAYKDHLKNETEVAAQAKQMSKLTQRILSSVDYEDIQKRRYENFLVLHAAFKEKNQLKIDTSSGTPVAYPLVISDEGLRKKLIDNKIYVPCWWRHVLDLVNENDVEYSLSKYLLPLPIDQRYNQDHMKQLVEIFEGIQKQ